MEKKTFRYNINTLLIALVAFFATWGEGMQMILPRASLLFPLLVVVYIIWNFIPFLNTIERKRILKTIREKKTVKTVLRRRIVPREFKYLFVFVVIHTLIYVSLNNNSFSFSTEMGNANVEGFSYGKSGSGTVLVRYLLFLLFSLFLTVSLSKERNIKVFSLFYSLGFCGTILLGGASHGYANSLIRFSGGLQDPNAMGFDGLIALMFTLYYLKCFRTNKTKILLYFLLLVEIVAILLSFSRGAYLALFIWAFLYFCRIGLFKHLWKIVIVLFILIIAGNLVLKKMQIDSDTLRTRFSLEEIRESKGSTRGDIWAAYLANINKYFVLGVGFNNSPSVIKGNTQGVDERYETHNLYLQFLVEYGFIGCLLYLLYWLGFVKLFKRIRGPVFFLYSMGILMMLITAFLNIDKGRTFWIVFAVINMVWMRYKALGVKQRRKNESISCLRTSR